MELGYTEPDPRDDLSGADVGRKALILGRLLGFSGEPDDVGGRIAGAGGDAQAGARRVPDQAAGRRRRLGASARPPRRPRARRCATWRPWARTASRVGLQTVGRASPFFGLKGTDNQVAFTTVRYRKNPLVITGPGAGPAVTAAGVLNDILRLT